MAIGSFNAWQDNYHDSGASPTYNHHFLGTGLADRSESSRNRGNFAEEQIINSVRGGTTRAEYGIPGASKKDNGKIGFADIVSDKKVFEIKNGSPSGTKKAKFEANRYVKIANAAVGSPSGFSVGGGFRNGEKKAVSEVPASDFPAHNRASFPNGATIDLRWKGIGAGGVTYQFVRIPKPGKKVPAGAGRGSRLFGGGFSSSTSGNKSKASASAMRARSTAAGAYAPAMSSPFAFAPSPRNGSGAVVGGVPRLVPPLFMGGGFDFGAPRGGAAKRATSSFVPSGNSQGSRQVLAARGGGRGRSMAGRYGVPPVQTPTLSFDYFGEDGRPYTVLHDEEEVGGEAGRSGPRKRSRERNGRQVLSASGVDDIEDANARAGRNANTSGGGGSSSSSARPKRAKLSSEVVVPDSVVAGAGPGMGPGSGLPPPAHAMPAARSAPLAPSREVQIAALVATAKRLHHYKAADIGWYGDQEDKREYNNATRALNEEFGLSWEEINRRLEE